MSSSGELPDWSEFLERELPAQDLSLVSPAAEVTTLLQFIRAERDRLSATADDGRREAHALVATLAVLTAQLGMALERYEAPLQAGALGRIHRHLRVLKDQMLDALAAQGFEVSLPLGQPFDAVAEEVHVEGWRHLADATGETVDEVIEPIVRCRGEIVRMGRVVMSAPLEARPQEMQDSQEPTAEPQKGE